MTQPKFARLAGKVLGEAAHEEVAPPSPEARGVAIAAIEGAIKARARKRRVMRGLVAVSAAAAAALFGLGAARMMDRGPSPASAVRASAPLVAPAAPAGPVIVVHASGEGASVTGGTPYAGGGQSLAPGARVAALPHGSALLAFQTGTAVNVEAGSEVTLVEDGPSQVLALGDGALRADVAKLKQGERFIVRTGDAEIEVHGTSFRVSTAPADPACGDGTTTRVAVFEGVVTVRHAGAEDRVPAGDAWPRGCAARRDPTGLPAGDAGDAPSAPKAPAVAPKAPAVAPVAPPAPLSASDLARQNDMFAAALDAKRRGDASDAEARFDAFLAAYPTSALAENAAAEKMRVLQGAGSPRAQSAARAYLARWPDGFARAEADEILAGAAP